MQSRFSELRKALQDACERLYATRLVSLAVFGSWAREAATPLSDVDVLLVARELPRGRGKRLDEFAAVEEETRDAQRDVWPEHAGTTELSPVIKTPEEVEEGSPLFLDMTVACDILCDRERFLEGYLDGLRRRMDSLGSRRCSRKGGYYWEYKPDIQPGEVVRL